MTFNLSRRSFLRQATALAGLCAAPSLWSGFANAQSRYSTTRPDLPEDFGEQQSVAILGAGVAGLTAAYVLANAGFRVAVFEADSRFGGRSLTARPADEAYRNWWFDKYDPDRRFPEMYVSSYQERSDSPVPDLQTCEFRDDLWDPDAQGSGPVELYLNAGPGRIPSNHVNLIALCQEIGVDLETYVFQSMANLMQGNSYNGGAPVAMGQMTYSLYSEMADIIAKAKHDACLLGGEARKVSELAQTFGGLIRDPEDPKNACTLRMDDQSQRVGFASIPGGWRDAPVSRDRIPLGDILNSNFVGDPEANPELSPGSFLFNGFNIDWQPTLMQPVGGMDRIWQQLLLQDVPKSAFINSSTRPKFPKLGDLVQLNTRAIKVSVTRSEVEIVTRSETPDLSPSDHVHKFDFCISTMAPSLLEKVLDRSEELPPEFYDGLTAFSATGDWGGNDPTPNLWTPAIKVGWQSKSRFWETEDQIYGGISWTEDIIGQIWYPSEDFTAHTGVLTGAYNRGKGAAIFAQFTKDERLGAAIHGLGLLHPGQQDQIYTDRGLSIAWQYMPYQVGGWASDTASVDETRIHYEQITSFNPRGRFFCAGDTWSYLPGWQEGAVASAYCAVTAIAHAIDQSNPAFQNSPCFATSG